MRRVALLIALAILAAIAVAAPAAAVAAGCAANPTGGQAPPVLDTASTTSFHEATAGGYTCSAAQWYAAIRFDYESGGTWHVDTAVLGDLWPTGTGYFPANTFEYWQDPSFTPTDTLAPACARNWRYDVNFIDQTGFVFQRTISATLHKAC